jgi:hypothetical protein
MQHLIDEGRQRFAEALKSVTPVDGARTPEPGNTANMRLMVAYLTVCRCSAEHFADAAVHADFVTWVHELRTVSGGRSATAAIADLPRLQCTEFAQRLRAIAQRVTVPAR